MVAVQRKKKLEANIWKFYLHRVFASLTFVSPIFVLFLQDNGLSMTQIMILQSVYTAVIMLAAVPAGIAADYIGRKKVLVVNLIFFLLGWITYGIGTTFWHFFIAEVLVALSFALFQASGTPFLYDTLRELEKEGDFKKTYGKVVAINSICWGIGSLIGGYIALYSLKLPFLVSAIPVLISFIISLTLTETKDYKHGEKHYITHLKDAAGFAAKHSKVRFLIFYEALVFGMIFILSMMYQPYLKAISMPLVFFGAIYLLDSLFYALGGKIAHRVESYIGDKRVLLAALVIFALCCLGMSYINVMIGVIFLVILAFMGGLIDPIVTDYLNRNVESHHRSTITSFGLLITEGFSAAIAPFFGWMIDVYTLQAAFMISAGIIGLAFILFLGIYLLGRRIEFLQI